MSKEMTLKKCGQHDKQNDAKNKLTGWGIICKKRTGIGISRKDRIRAKKGLK